MSVGLVTTKYITDATTAVFAAHNESRLNTLEIAPQLIERRVDVLFGGGEDDFLPVDVPGCHPGMGNRLDGRDLLAEAEELGYTLICDQDGFDQLDAAADTLVLGLFGDENMERPYSPSLADMTETAIAILSQDPDGFFLMVEGAMIDIYSHFNQTTEMMEEVAWFDKAIQVGVDHAENEPDTLILVTADHETGGLVVELEPGIHEDEQGPFYMPNAIEFYVTWLTAEHTHAKVPVTASGPGADRLRGVHENTAVFDLMLDYLGLENAVESE
jgi:alkaline phosphatase